MEPRFLAPEHLAEHSLPSQGGQPLPSALVSGCFSTLVVNPVFVSSPTWAPGKSRGGSETGGGVSVEEGDIQGVGEDGQEQLVSRHGRWAVRGQGLLTLQTLTAHSSRPAFQMRKPGFLRCGNSLGTAPGASGILGDGGFVECLKEGDCLKKWENKNIVEIILIPTTNSYTSVPCMHTHQTDRHKIYGPSA